jgi:hypothetical protein
MDDKTLYLYCETYHPDSTTIHISVNKLTARTIIDTLISQLTDGELPHFSVYGQLLTMADHLNTEEPTDVE